MIEIPPFNMIFVRLLCVCAVCVCAMAFLSLPKCHTFWWCRNRCRFSVEYFSIYQRIIGAKNNTHSNGRTVPNQIASSEKYTRKKKLKQLNRQNSWSVHATAAERWQCWMPGSTSDTLRQQINELWIWATDQKRLLLHSIVGRSVAGWTPLSLSTLVVLAIQMKNLHSIFHGTANYLVYPNVFERIGRTAPFSTWTIGHGACDLNAFGQTDWQFIHFFCVFVASACYSDSSFECAIWSAAYLRLG